MGTQDQHDSVETLYLLIDTLKEQIRLYEKRDKLQEERYRIMVVKAENLRTDLRRALESLRRLEEMHD